MRRFFVSVAILAMVLFSSHFLYSDDSTNKNPSGYVTTDMWLLGVDVYRPIALDHVVLPYVMTQSQIRSIGADPQCTFVYYSDEYDIAIFGTLQIVVYYRNGVTANIICLGDAVQ